MPETPLARTPEPPYFAVIFSSLRTEGDLGYSATAERMMALASKQPGFLGADSVHDAAGRGITVSYWVNEEAIRAWKAQAEHRIAQDRGKSTWYADYQIRIARVDRAYSKSP